MHSVIINAKKDNAQEKPVKKSGLLNRLVIGFSLASFSILIVIWGAVPLAVEVLIIGIVGVDEFYNLAVKKGIRPSRTNGYIATTALITFTFWGREENLPALLVGLLIISMLGYLFRKGFHVSSFLDVGVTVLGYLYVGWTLSYIIFMRCMEGAPLKFLGTNVERGAGYVLLLIFATHFTDVGAFFIGRFFGKHKLAPHVSPKKTIEGAIGGLASAVAGALLIGLPLKMSLPDLITVGLLCGIFSQLGDLWASILKRDVNAKDSGNIFASHGGVLDRFDSLMFTSPVIYYYLKYFYM